LTDEKEKTVFLGEIFGPDLLIVVIVVAVLIFGGSAIPKLAKNLGSAKNEFEKGLKEGKDSSATKASDTTETKTPEADK
jgi:sec-independent protein translocase protein TatA